MSWDGAGKSVVTEQMQQYFADLSMYEVQRPEKLGRREMTVWPMVQQAISVGGAECSPAEQVSDTDERSKVARCLAG